MSEEKTITLDPITQKEFNQIVQESYEVFVETLDIDSVNDMDLHEALFMFFLNGFYLGASTMAKSTELKETIYMMTKEIDYQVK